LPVLTGAPEIKKYAGAPEIKKYATAKHQGGILKNPKI
jgi:hypothetical protein